MTHQPGYLWRPFNRHPLLWVALAFSGGIAASRYLWRPPVWWLVAAAVFSLAAFYFAVRRTGFAFLLGLSAVFASGVFTSEVRLRADDETPRLFAFTDGQEVSIIGHIKAVGDCREYSDGELRQTAQVETEQISSETKDSVAERAVVRVNIYGKRKQGEDDALPSAARIFHYGERLQFPAKLSLPRNFRNPGAFDYRGFLASKGIMALGSTKRDAVKVLPGFAGSQFELWRTNLRERILKKIESLWSTQDAALVQAILFGEDVGMDQAALLAFQRTGTYHVLVVSGLKVAVLVLMIFWVLQVLHVGHVWASAITILLTTGYALLTDVGAPVWRATLMLMVYLIAKFFYRQRSTLNAIGAAALMLLILDPGQVWDASFQLSFLCVLIIAGVAMPILERTTQSFARSFRHLDSTSYDILLLPRMVQFRLDLRIIAQHSARFLGKRIPLFAIGLAARAWLPVVEFVLISTAIQIGLALPMVWYFHRATLTSLPGNILAVPLTELAMIASIIAIGAAWIAVPLAKIPITITSFALHGMSGAVHWLSRWQLSDARVATPSPVMLLLAAGALILAMILVRRRVWLMMTGLFLMTASTIWLCVVAPQPQIHIGVMEITAIDVGQGDAILLVSPQGKTLLVDAGGIPAWMHSDLDIGDEVVSPYLWLRGFSRLDAVAVTHAHSDHIGGMSAILANFRPRELWVGVDTPTPELQNLLGRAKDLGVNVVFRNAGDAYWFGGSHVRILAPAVGSQSSERRRNEDSMVMKVSFENTSALLEGDAERAAEYQIMDEDPKADLLKVAHHGSATSTQQELLEAVQPRFAVISVGARNTYGHPRNEVLERLEAMNVATYRTDLNGAVTFHLDGKSVSADVPSLW